MIVAIARAELHLPASRSLKQKRQVIKSLVDRCSHHLRVSIAETGHHDLRQRAELGVALVHGQRGQAEKILQQIHRMFEDEAEAQLITWDDEYFEDFE
jgi:uncharacterized protein YlxP (DUF503 family)